MLMKLGLRPTVIHYDGVSLKVFLGVEEQPGGLPNRMGVNGVVRRLI